ncbi:MAG: glycerophosphoryl diester phosphodiesterase membrane domain-containing protein, partial [Pseudomonadota bacterium]|nr:glycerophosphoryl diester phosphodiesterase membrane domain-containing protein [Pseudomonadota bacterium]
MKQAISEVVRCFEVAWRLRWPFIQSHLVFNILLAAAFAPLMAATVHLALTFSGKPALADFDIAVFLFSPVGFVAGLVIAGMALVLLTLDVSFMMAVALRDRVGKSHGFLDGVAVVLPRVPAVLGLAVQFCLRLLLMCLPFLAVCGLAFFSWMKEFDINYYLSFHPPEFVQTVVVCGIALALMMALVLWRTLGWVLALPLVVFDGLRAGEALRESQFQMAGRRLAFLVRLAIWAAIGAVIGGAVLFVVGAIIQFGLHFVPFGLKGLAAF